MKATFISDARETVSGFLYDGLNKHSQIGRFAALPVALLETSMLIGSLPLEIIENIALVPINAIGCCCFSEKLSLKDMGICLVKVVTSPVSLLILFAVSPILLACQTLNILIRPHKAQSMRTEIEALRARESVEY